MTFDGLIALRDAVSDVGKVLAIGVFGTSVAILPYGWLALGAAWAEPVGFAYLCLTASCLLFEECLRPVQ